MCADRDTVRTDMLALESARQFEPFRTLHTQALGAAIEHLDIVGSAAAGRTVEGLMRPQPRDIDLVGRADECRWREINIGALRA